MTPGLKGYRKNSGPCHRVEGVTARVRSALTTRRAEVFDPGRWRSVMRRTERDRTRRRSGSIARAVRRGELDAA